MSRLRMGRALALVVILWLGVFLLMSCQPAQPLATPKPAEKGAETPVRGGTLRISHYADPITLDGHMNGMLFPGNSIYDLLIEPDTKGNVTKEGLFKDWTISPDGKTLTFKLQGGGKFHDGTDLDAAAVKWNIERIKDPATKSMYSSNYDFVTSVDAVDALTVRFNLKQPDPILLGRMTTQAGMMVSPAAVKKLGQDFARKPVGSGPFQFVEWAAGDHITLKRFDGYWGKDKAGNQLPYLDGVVFQTITDPDVALANLRTGQADVIVAAPSGFPPEQMPVLKADANLTYVVEQASQNVALYLNAVRPPFDKKALRQAVALALDREGITSRLGETVRPNASALHPTTWAYDGKAGVFPSRDVAKGKAKVAEAGYPSGGVKAAFLAINEPNMLRNAEILKANLAEIGIDMEIRVVAVAAWQTAVATVGGEYQISGGTTAPGPPDPGFDASVRWHSQGTRNFFGPYGNPQIDQFLEKAANTYDQGERTSLYRQAAQIWVDEALQIPLYVPNLISPMSKKVRDYFLGPTRSTGLKGTWLAK